MAFPSYLKLDFNGFKRTADSAVLRSDMEGGVATADMETDHGGQ